MDRFAAGSAVDDYFVVSQLKKSGRMKWADPGKVKDELDHQTAALLGPKTEVYSLLCILCVLRSSLLDSHLFSITKG